MKILTYEWHKGKGAVFQDFFGTEIPASYGDLDSEYWALRKTVGLRDVSYFGKIRVTGKDARDFLHRMLSNDIRSVSDGNGVWTLLLDDRGRIQSDMKIYGMPDDSLLIVLPHYMREKITAELDRYIIREDVILQDATADWAMFQLLGPHAAGVLNANGLPHPPEEDYSHIPVLLGGAPCRLIRLPLAYAILAPASAAAAALDSLHTPDARLVGMEGFNIFRIEAGLPLMHVDMDETNLPQEARLGGALNFHKGCYLGQETMARLDARGGHVNWLLSVMTAASAIAAGQKIYQGDSEVGRVTSAAFSPMLRQPVALGYLRHESAAPGQAVAVGDDRTTGVVIPLPAREQA